MIKFFKCHEGDFWSKIFISQNSAEKQSQEDIYRERHRYTDIDVDVIGQAVMKARKFHEMSASWRPVV